MGIVVIQSYGIDIVIAKMSSAIAERWKRAAYKARERFRLSRPEWRPFGGRMLSILLHLVNEDHSQAQEDFSDLSSNENRTILIGLFAANQEFMREFLSVCLETRKGELHNYIELVEEALHTIQFDNVHFSNRQRFWQDIFEGLYKKAVRDNDPRALREALTVAHDYKPIKVEEAWLNSEAFITACNDEQTRQVRMFLGKGYRLESSHFQKKVLSNAWKQDLPFRPPNAKNKDHHDNVQDLYILRAMSKPCYLLYSYSIVAGSLRSGLGDCGGKNSDLCSCCIQQMEASKVNNSSSSNSHCPYSIKYVPKLGCPVHASCSDPIFRSFEICQLAASAAKKAPEYREEYLAISKNCNQLASDLLDQCKDTTEVELLLGEKTGSIKYFKNDYIQRMTYPRLNMAIQNNHKEFVGHTFCQQILRTRWQGKVAWQNKTFVFKVVYVLLEFLFLPLHMLHFFTRLFFKDVGITRKKWGGFGLRYKTYDFLTGPCTLDEPFNKFINYTIMYIIFWYVLITCMSMAVYNPYDITNNFHGYHNALILLTFSRIVSDARALHSMRSFSTSLEFWVVYDIIMHFILCLAFAARLLMGKIYPCEDADHCDIDILLSRLPYETTASCFFSLAEVLTGLRLLYWFQLHDRFGPIVINISRVVTDIVTFSLIFFLMIYTFIMALLPLRVSNLRCDDFLNTTATRVRDDEDFPILKSFQSACWTTWNSTFWWPIAHEILSVMFWSILSPEEPTLFNSNTTEGQFSVILVGMYCVVSIIILLNLLIAVMNSSIQKIQGQQHLYWKFVRTCIWTEFFGEQHVLPIPFNLVMVVRSIVKRLAQWLGCKGKPTGQKEAMRAILSNESRQNKRLRMKQQQQLIMNLIERYWSRKSLKQNQNPLSKVANLIQNRNHLGSSGQPQAVTPMSSQVNEELKLDFENEVPGPG